jgi:hypothetical protein
MISKQAMFQKWNEVRKETGYRSGFEAQVAEHIPKTATYESVTIPYTMMVSSRYKPDFILHEQAMFIEVKGRFSMEDRAKMAQVKRQHPDLDIRLLFQSKRQRITKLMTAEDWCRKMGFPCAQGPEIPEEWLKHKPTKKQKEAFDSVLKSTQKTA